MKRSILVAILVFWMLATNAGAKSSSFQSIRDICYDAPQWLVKLDQNEPWWLGKNLANATVNDWKVASYTEKMATLAVFLLPREYERESATSNGDTDRNAGYECTGIVEILDREIDQHYLPDDFPVWECVLQMVELNRSIKRISLTKNNNFKYLSKIKNLVQF